MSIHIVKPGESLWVIAAHYGIADWHNIYNHPQNALLRSRRPNPNHIEPGDQLFIPANKQQSTVSQTTQSHSTQPMASKTSPDSGESLLLSGTIFVGSGLPSILRIPVPGTNGLHLELSPRGFVPKGGSTSTVFIQDLSGKRHLRLDYGYNKVTGKVDYHWNQKGTAEFFGITDHTPVGRTGKALYGAAKVFKYAGRTLVVVGAAMDLYSIVVAKKRWRQVLKVASGWAGAAAGTESLGALGAEIGTFIEPGLGTAIGGFVGGAVGGVAGYFGGSWAAGKTYDYVEETYFEKVPESR